MLHITGLQAAYGASQVLFDIHLSIAPGQVVTLLGRNGMGKSTTVRSILGLTPAKGGEIRFDGQPIQHLPPEAIARRGIGLVPEGRLIFPTLSVRENLIACAANRLKRPNPWALDRIYALFPRLRERASHLGSNLSGGEQQMLAIGRALMTNPKLLILDEATEGLAPLIRAEIWSCLAGLKRDGQAILVIDKNLAALNKLADHHTILEKGRTVWSGTPADLAAAPEVAERYLGV